MNNKIKHLGTIDSIEGNCIRVKIMQSSACTSCKIASHCTSSESKEKIIDVYEKSTLNYTIGEQVILSANIGVGYIASLYAYVIPMVLMLLTLIIVQFTTHNEALSALMSIAVLIPYGIVLYFFKNKISKQVYFKIENEKL